jgi:hypothetical protein
MPDPDASPRGGRRRRRKAKSACRRGNHRYGGYQEVGGGIRRRVCLACASVTIDLTGAEAPREVFETREERTP